MTEIIGHGGIRMRKQFVYFVGLAVFVSLVSGAVSASAEMPSENFMVVRLGYVPFTKVVTGTGTGTAESGWDPDSRAYNYISRGPAFNIEYNINASPVLIALGLEYRLLWTKFSFGEGVPGSKATFDDGMQHFILPMVMAKYMTPGGVYIGAGISGKLLVAAERLKPMSSRVEYTQMLDYWAVAAVGYMLKLDDGLFIDLQGRFGYNLTNSQYTELKDKGTGETTFFDVKSSYGAAFYAGVAFSL